MIACGSHIVAARSRIRELRFLKGTESNVSFLVELFPFCSVAVGWGVCRCVASVSERRIRLAGPAHAREQPMCNKRNCLFVLTLTVVSTWSDFGISSDSIVRAIDIRCVRA